MKIIFRFAFILFLVNLIAATILAGTYNLTKSKIQEEVNLIQKEALEQVMPETVGDKLEPVKKGGAIEYWKVFKANNPHAQGYIFVAKKYGYSSVIETMVGMKKDGTITGVRVLSQNETPGLGAKIIEIVSTKTLFNSLKAVFIKEKKPREVSFPYFTEQFMNRNIKDLELSANGIHAITGATISSRAVVESIKSQGLKVLDNKDE
jgi:electron transport complex protein RnfG